MDYEQLNAWLKGQEGQTLNLSFDDIAQHLPEGLPPQARTNPQWWLGTSAHAPQHLHKGAWERAGYLATEVDLDAEQVTFSQATVEVRFEE